METPLKLAIFIIFTSLSSLSAVEESPLSATDFVAPVLTHLGFHELAMAVPSLPVTSSAATWSGPLTVFAPSDASIHTCSSCSVPSILQEHIAPGIFSLHYLQSLPFGTKIKTIVPGRCVRVTSTGNGTKLFVGGVEITRPEIFNNGLFVVHGIDGYVAHLSQFSCNVERITSLSFSRKISDGKPALSQYSTMPMISGSRLSIVCFSLLLIGCLLMVARGRRTETWECQECSEFNGFNSEVDLINHYKNFHSGFQLKCPEKKCRHKFGNQSKLLQHRVANHNFAVPNPIILRCLHHPNPPTFRTPAALGAHNKMHHFKDAVTCPNQHCLNVFPRKELHECNM